MKNNGFKIARDYLTGLLTLVRKKGAVRLNRGSEVFIIMKSEEYAKLKEQNSELRQSVKSLLATIGSEHQVVSVDIKIDG